MVNGCIYSLSNEKSIEIIMKVIIKSTLIKKKTTGNLKILSIGMDYGLRYYISTSHL